MLNLLYMAYSLELKNLLQSRLICKFLLKLNPYLLLLPLDFLQKHLLLIVQEYIEASPAVYTPVLFVLPRKSVAIPPICFHIPVVYQNHMIESLAQNHLVLIWFLRCNRYSEEEEKTGSVEEERINGGKVVMISPSLHLLSTFINPN